MTAPGDLVQVDTVDVRPRPGVILKHFTAADVVSRWSVAEVAGTATASVAVRMLDALASRLPYPVRAIQVDGGSEFMAEFEAACQTRGIRLFVLPPRSPKLNGCVERTNRTWREEFYACTTAASTVSGAGCGGARMGDGVQHDSTAPGARVSDPGRVAGDLAHRAPLINGHHRHQSHRREGVTEVLDQYTTTSAPTAPSIIGGLHSQAWSYVQ